MRCRNIHLGKKPPHYLRAQGTKAQLLLWDAGWALMCFAGLCLCSDGHSPGWTCVVALWQLGEVGSRELGGCRGLTPVAGSADIYLPPDKLVQTPRRHALVCNRHICARQMFDLELASLLWQRGKELGQMIFPLDVSGLGGFMQLAADSGIGAELRAEWSWLSPATVQHPSPAV